MAKPSGGDGSFPPESSSQSGGLYMDNLVAIAEYLISNGYSPAAAAGVAGTIAGESTGNPESVGSGGNGLIGWTPPKSGIVTGDAKKDFDTQLGDILSYADANSSEAVARGGVDLSTFKKATDPNKAATWWSMFEGPANPGSDVRSAAVSSVYAKVKDFKPNSAWLGPGGGSSPSGGDGSGGLLSIPGDITTFFDDASKMVTALMWLAQPSSWVRIVSFLAGLGLVLFAIHAFIAIGEGGDIMPKAPPIVPIPV